MAPKVKEPVAVAPASSQNASSKVGDSTTGNSKTGGPLISNEKLRRLYSTMLQCRLLEEKALGLKKMARFKSNYYSAVGQEAAIVGAALDLRPEDTLLSFHRDFITPFIKGMPLNALFSHLFGRNTGPDMAPRSLPQNGCAPPAPSSNFSAQLNIGNGIALANKMLKNDNLVVAFFDADPKSLELFLEALNFAGAHNLPIVFVCQNNLLKESLPLWSQTKVEDISLKAQACGFPGIPVDGKDVVAVYRVAYESIQRARNGGGPTLIEAKTPSRDGHSSMNPANDPIAAMERYLSQRKLFAPAWKQQIIASFGKELDAAIHFVGKSPQTVPTEYLDHAYAFNVCQPF